SADSMSNSRPSSHSGGSGSNGQITPFFSTAFGIALLPREFPAEFLRLRHSTPARRRTKIKGDRGNTAFPGDTGKGRRSLRTGSPGLRKGRTRGRSGRPVWSGEMRRIGGGGWTSTAFLRE